MGKAVFCYGTLEFPQIMAAVTGRRFAQRAAVLDGYARYLLKGAPYPGIIAAPEQLTPGTLYLAVDRDALRRLDRYEDSVYVRRTHTVRIVGDGTVAAEVYVIPDHRRWMLSSHPWDRARFARTHLAGYLARLAPT